MYKRLYFAVLPLALLLGAVILVGGQSLASAQQSLLSAIPIPAWGTDIRVNPTTTAPLIAQRNMSMAVNPLNPNLIIASYDNNEKDVRHSGRAESTDAGLTWNAGRFECCWGNGLQPLGDTNVAFDALGTGYYTSIGISQSENGYYVLTTTNGLAWSTPVPIVVTNYDEYRFQSNLAIDPRASGPYARSLYFSYLFSNLNQPFYQGIWLRHSRDGGQTWSPQTKVSDNGREYSRSPSVAVASNGVVYLAYEHVANYVITNPPEHYLDRSTDGGVTWSTDRLISGAPIVPIGVPDFKHRELVLITEDDDCSMARMFHYVQIAVSPLDSNSVYAVWNDGRWDSQFTLCSGTGKHADIAFSRTTDGGVTWTAPMRVNDDPMGNGRDQYQPTINVAPDGTIGLTWYDRRYNSNEFLYDLAYSQSTDGGITWSTNVRVSDISSDAREVPDYKNINDVSYRKALVYGPNYALPGWLDTRRGNLQGDFMVDRGTFPLLTPTATQTSIVTQTQPPTVSTATRTATTIPTQTPGGATPTPCTLTFTDVPTNNTFYESIRCLACRGIISGYSDGTFRPNNQVTRGQLAKIVSNSAGFTEPPTQQTFEDVSSTNTFYEWIERLTTRGYMTGYNCGGAGEPCVSGKPYFRPFANATRGQTSKIIANAAGFTEPPVGQTFEDVPSTHTFYTEIQRLASRNIMGGYACGGPGEPCLSGKPYFRPGNDVTRGQSSKIVANTFFPTCNP